MNTREEKGLKLQNKYIKVCCVEQYNGDFPPADLLGFHEWLKTQINKIPAKHRPGAQIRLTDHSCYDSGYVEIEIYYTRPETDKEMSERLQADENRIKAARDQEYALLQQLKRKFGEQS